MNIPFIDLQDQYATIKEEIDRIVSDVISNSAFIGGSYVQSFGSDFAKVCNAEHFVGVGNGTDALFIALNTPGVGGVPNAIPVTGDWTVDGKTKIGIYADGGQDHGIWYLD